MSNPEAIPEPSMEDILASIRQIIAEGDDHSPEAAKSKRGAEPEPEPEPEPEAAAPAEDDPYAAAAGQASGEADDDVFDLTDEMVSDGAAEAAEPIPFPQPASGVEEPEEPAVPDVVAQASSAEPDEAPGEGGFDDLEFRTPTEPAASAAAAMQSEFGTEPIAPEAPQVSAEDALLSAAAGQAVAQAFGRLTRRPTAAADGRTIEELVVDMLRPMLKDWLDDNLPMLVERLVRDEIERVTRGRR